LVKVSPKVNCTTNLKVIPHKVNKAKKNIVAKQRKTILEVVTMFRRSVNYLSWNEYTTRVRQIETLWFLHNTTLLSARNFWKKANRRC